MGFADVRTYGELFFFIFIFYFFYFFILKNLYLPYPFFNTFLLLTFCQFVGRNGFHGGRNGLRGCTDIWWVVFFIFIFDFFYFFILKKNLYLPVLSFLLVHGVEMDFASSRRCIFFRIKKTYTYLAPFFNNTLVFLFSLDWICKFI